MKASDLEWSPSSPLFSTPFLASLFQDLSLIVIEVELSKLARLRSGLAHAFQ